MIRSLSHALPRRAPLLLPLLLLVAAACGPLRRTPVGERTVVTFINESTTQADLFAVTTGNTVRLATIGPNRTETLTLPESVVGAGGAGVNFVARLFPSRNAIESGAVTITRGDALTVRLPPGLNFLVVTPG